MAYAHDRTLLASLGFADPDKKDPRHDLACQYMALSEVRQTLVERYGKSLDKFNETLKASGYDQSWSTYKWTLTHTKPRPHVCNVKSVQLEWPLTKGEAQYKTSIGFLDALVHYSVIRSVDITTTSLQYTNSSPGNRDWPSAWVDKQSAEVRAEYIRVSAKTANRMWRDQAAMEAWMNAHKEDERVYTEEWRKACAESEANVPKNWAGERHRAFFGSQNWPTKTEVQSCEDEFYIAVEVKIAEKPIGDVLRQLALYSSHMRQSHTWVLVTSYEISQVDLDTYTAHGVNHVRLGAKFDAFVAEQLNKPRVAGGEL